MRVLCRPEEGRQAPVGSHNCASIWRGAPYPKHIHLLDNDFFGQPRVQWEARLDEVRSGRVQDLP
jgi:hypothetical protein